MKSIRCLLVLALLSGCYYSSAQKTAAGIKFSACLNKKDLPANFYRGKFVVLDFWATWCGPCIASFPKINALQKKYSANPDIIFASITAEPKGFVDTFFHRKKDMMPGVLHLVDDSGATWSYFAVYLIPNLLVFAPSGKIIFSGCAEELSGCMDKLLKGQNLYKEPQPEKPAVDKWDQYLQTASFIAIIRPADTAGEGGGHNINYNSDFSSVNYNMNKCRLLDIVSQIAGLTSLDFRCSDSAKANQLISGYYKQVKNDFPEFDKGIFSYEYQNHILDLLEKIYSFHTEWIKEQVSAYKIIVKNKQLLDNARTLSTHGSYSSSSGAKKVTFVNQSLSGIARSAEDYLNVPSFADTVSEGYDLDLDFSSVPALEKSLSGYGLALEKNDDYETKKLKLVFY